MISDNGIESYAFARRQGPRTASGDSNRPPLTELRCCWLSLVAIGTGIAR